MSQGEIRAVTGTSVPSAEEIAYMEKHHPAALTEVGPPAEDDLPQQAADLLRAHAEAVPLNLDGPGVIACGGCGRIDFNVTAAGRLICANDDCYRLNGYAVITR